MMLRPSPIMSIEELERVVTSCERRIEANQQQMQKLVAERYSISRKFGRLMDLRTSLQLIESDAKQLDGSLASTVDLAKGVSYKIEMLDIISSRLNASLQRVEDLIELKFCTDGVQDALAQNDLSKAAQHIHRYLDLDEDILRMFTDSSDSKELEDSFVMLKQADGRLKAMLKDQCDEAVSSENAEALRKNLKIFSLLKIEQEGVEFFAKFFAKRFEVRYADGLSKLSGICDGEKYHVKYALAVRELLQFLINVITDHAELIVSSYGAGHLLPFVETLQDRLHPYFQSLFDDCVRERQLANTQKLIADTFASQHNRHGFERIDVKAVDILLVETSGIVASIQKYLAFVKQRVKHDRESAPANESTPVMKSSDSAVQSPTTKTEPVKSSSNTSQTEAIDKFVIDSKLSHLSFTLADYCVCFEEFYLKETVSKAVSLDSTQMGSTAGSQSSDEVVEANFSLVDDVFFIVDKSLQRSLSCGRVDALCATLNHAYQVIEDQLGAVLKARLRLGLPHSSSTVALDFAANLLSGVGGTGATQQAQAATARQRRTFFEAINAVGQTIDNVGRLVASVRQRADRQFGNNKKTPEGEQMLSILHEVLNNLDGLKEAFERTLRTDGCDLVVNKLLAPNLKTWLEPLNALPFNIDEREYEAYNAADHWVSGFTYYISNFLQQFKTMLLPTCYDVLVDDVIRAVAADIEKVIMKKRFSFFGALQLERDMRRLQSNVADLTSWSTRGKMQRVARLTALLASESIDEAQSTLAASADGDSRWSHADAKKVLRLRVDFDESRVTALSF